MRTKVFFILNQKREKNTLVVSIRKHRTFSPIFSKKKSIILSRGILMREALRFKIKDIAYIGVFAALQCIISGFAIPIGPISITLATLGIYLFSALFPIRISVSVVIVYILLGIIGLPVFSNFNSGIAVLTGVTGGYIIGYIPLALIEGILIEVFKDKKWTYPIWMIVGTIVLYLLGSIHFFFVNNQATTFFHILKVCVFPFIPIDLAKIVIATLLSIKLRPIVMRNLY